MVGTVTRIVLFTETNSVFGDYFLTRLASHDDVTLAAVALREPGALCDYYLDEPEPVDLVEKAAQLRVQALRPSNVNTQEFVSAVEDLVPDFFIVANYQLPLGKRLLEVPRCDAINFHPSPLLRYAGLAPFYWMAEGHETEGGVSVVRMTTGLDEGPLVAQQFLSLTGTETATEIRDLHFAASWRLFDLVLPTLLERSYRTWDQDLSQRTYFGHPPVDNAETVLDSHV